MKKIGFIGLGHMGFPMMKNLISKGFEVTAFDVNEAALTQAKEAGASIAKDLPSILKSIDCVITSVQTGKQVSDICLKPDGLFSKAKSNLLFIDCSSIDIGTTRTLHDRAKSVGIKMLDAPVSGGVAGATAGTLTFMVGGSSEDFDLALPILSAMGKKIIHAGKPGTGQAAKICNNLLLGISMIGVSEAFLLAEKLGLEPQKFYEISSNASGQCWSMTSYCPYPGILPNVPSSHDYQPGFTAKMMLKDLRLGQDAAKEVDATIPLGAVASELYELLINNECGEKDFSAIIKLLAGVV